MNTSNPAPHPERDPIPTYAEHTRTTAKLLRELSQSQREVSAKHIAQMKELLEQFVAISTSEITRFRAQERRIGILSTQVNALALQVETLVAQLRNGR